jgi:signal transduction histidine kinase
MGHDLAGSRQPRTATPAGSLSSVRWRTESPRQVRRLASVASSGALDAALVAQVRGRSETARLATAFATMLAALRDSKQQQRQFVQDAGHELRAPLASLRANVDTLARYPDLDLAQRTSILYDLQTEFRELTQLMNEIVMLAIDPDDDENAVDIALDELACASVERARRRTARRIDVCAEPTCVHGLPRQLRRTGNRARDRGTPRGVGHCTQPPRRRCRVHPHNRRWVTGTGLDTPPDDLPRSSTTTGRQLLGVAAVSGPPRTQLI